MTDAERRLWSLIRDRRFLGLKFRRQAAFGPYYLDFYCAERSLAIELDGGQHYSEEGRARDARRNAFLSAQGLTVRRYSDRDMLLQADAVLRALEQLLMARQSSPQPSPFQGEGE